MFEKMGQKKKTVEWVSVTIQFITRLTCWQKFHITMKRIYKATWFLLLAFKANWNMKKVCGKIEVLMLGTIHKVLIHSPFAHHNLWLLKLISIIRAAHPSSGTWGVKLRVFTNLAFSQHTVSGIPISHFIFHPFGQALWFSHLSLLIL